MIGFWTSMPFIIFALSYIMYGERIFQDWRVAALTYPIIYFIGYFSWRLHGVYDQYLRHKFPKLEETAKRVKYKFLVNLLIMSPSVLVIFMVFHYFHVLGYNLNLEDLKYGFFVGLTINIIFESLWEVLYIIEKFRDVAEEKEHIEQLQLHHEFENLKQKVNPHFLFNSFNTLSSLIGEDKVRAEKFLDELSRVYRYLLNNNERGMNSVEQETDFIRTYFQLLQTRYGNSLQMSIDIDPAFNHLEIPSLSLQLLVENAVKHNVLSKNNPVHVHIRTTPDKRIEVENNLNKKVLTVDSTGIGLSNIKKKYELLQREDVFIQSDDNKFLVSIPLIDQ